MFRLRVTLAALWPEALAHVSVQWSTINTHDATLSTIVGRPSSMPVEQTQRRVPKPRTPCLPPLPSTSVLAHMLLERRSLILHGSRQGSCFLELAPSLCLGCGYLNQAPQNSRFPTNDHTAHQEGETNCVCVSECLRIRCGRRKEGEVLKWRHKTEGWQVRERLQVARGQFSCTTSHEFQFQSTGT